MKRSGCFGRGLLLVRGGPMQDRYNVSFLGVRNSTRSIIAESILNRKGSSNFTAYSAGSAPSQSAHPAAIRQLKIAGLPTAGLHTKSWAEFATPGAPYLYFVFTPVIALRMKFARSGRGTLSRDTGVSRIRPRLMVPRQKSASLHGCFHASGGAESASFCVCAWMTWQSKAKLAS